MNYMSPCHTLNSSTAEVLSLYEAWEGLYKKTSIVQSAGLGWSLSCGATFVPDAPVRAEKTSSCLAAASSNELRQTQDLGGGNHIGRGVPSLVERQALLLKDDLQPLDRRSRRGVALSNGAEDDGRLAQRDGDLAGRQVEGRVRRLRGGDALAARGSHGRDADLVVGGGGTGLEVALGLGPDGRVEGLRVARHGEVGARETAVVLDDVVLGDIVEVEGARVAGGGGSEGGRAEGANEGLVEVQGGAEAGDEVLHGDGLAVAGEVAVVGERVEHRARTADGAAGNIGGEPGVSCGSGVAGDGGTGDGHGAGCREDC
ncbi:hypothetical protein JMJ77_0015277 [Colletotrichum scovillei]|uniref:Uncharacterized protein n=1 Tax=Colletotrichum scovillei TaxID=1209932 RepID=A0A9P7R1T7_9PEZI|nr:hypothetical protein JMJ77_0015277 [Colletotrichum scovillei]KAG7056933.1 hypothetical protein JMJ78_0000721 [Colletotrichum scovillei]KAG7066827.1 hypothetical protein JMJ76_0000678 [Colletotrichum scovillei]